MSYRSRLIAAFCMPGLEKIAEPLLPWTKSLPKAVAMVGFLSARAVFQSGEQAEAELVEGGWDEVRTRAAAFGRELPAKAPTFDQLHHLRERIEADGVLGEVLVKIADAFTAQAVILARSRGMLLRPGEVDLLDPSRVCTLYADGTWWKAWSNVSIDPDTGEVIGSRAKNPRIAQKLQAVKDGNNLSGVPFVMCGVRGAEERDRVVLGYRRFFDPTRSKEDKGEMPAAMDLLERVIAAADGGALWCVYDMALKGEHLNRLAEKGVVGVAAMSQPTTSKTTELLPDSGPTRFNNDSRKTLVAVASLGTAKHYVGGRWCDHELSAVDGALRFHAVTEEPTSASPLCVPTGLRFEPGPGGKQRLIGTFEIPCPHGPVSREIEFTGYLKEERGLLVLNRLRPINEYVEEFRDLKGWRQDVESLHSTMKDFVFKYGRASSLDPAHHELDVLGMALQVNAQCWDTHIAQMTPSAERAKKRKQKQVLRKKIDFSDDD